MERIKIGDVTIERRVSKPQQPKTPVDSFGCNPPQFPSPSKNNPPKKTEEGKGVAQNNLFKVDQQVSIKNIPKPAVTNKTIHLGENIDLKSTSRFLENPQISIQKFSNNLQNIRSNPFIEKFSGSSMPKVPKIDSQAKQFPAAVNSNQPRSLPNGPDLSKLVGISIERRKRADSESQPPKPQIGGEPINQSLSPDINTAVKDNKDMGFEPEFYDGDDFDDDDFDESFDEEDFEPEPGFEDEEGGAISKEVQEFFHSKEPFKSIVKKDVTNNVKTPLENKEKEEIVTDKNTKEGSLEQTKLEATGENVKETVEKSEKENVAENIQDTVNEINADEIEHINSETLKNISEEDLDQISKDTLENVQESIENITKEDFAEPKKDDVEETKEEKEDEEIPDFELEEEEECPKETDINDLACTDLMELMKKGAIEGEIEEVKEEEEDEEEIESEEVKGQKRKAEDMSEEEIKVESGKKKRKKKKKTEKKDKQSNEVEVDVEEEDEDEDDDEEDDEEKDKEKNIDKSKVTNAALRKNIREVMDETKLDEATLAAQRQEAERLKRLQEQQRIIREVQRQIALNRQNQKSQNKVLSLLQGNSQTSILKTSAASPQFPVPQSKNQSSVLVKLSNGEQASLNNRQMMELLRSSKNKPELGKPVFAKSFLKQGMVSPSVTIAPIAKREIPEDEKKKKKDVVTISSDSEDDCIVLSDEEESEPEEDPTNSGMHTNDKYNLPDEKGRVIVNVGHPESESDLYLAPQIAKIIKPHQIGGIRFLYDNVIESIDRFQNSAGFGCILAHSMGLGKTLQIVSFSDIFLRYTSAKSILCIMPINTIQNWLAEFNMWLPKESSSEEVRCRDFDLFIVNESLKTLHARAKVILEWKKNGGVLLMGYELFRLLSLKKLNKSKKKKDPEEENARNRELIEEVFSALVTPGPDLVICDEGHRIKNSHATTSQALKQIRTKRRIVLTGYPLQNNLMEYWCMVDFVRPNYLGTKTEFSNMFERPIQNGQCIDSTPQDKRLMRYRAHVLHSLLEGFVQRRSHAVLQSALPEKEEYVLLLRFTAFQRKLYDTFMNEVVRTVNVPNPLKAFAVCCKIWNHPDVLYNFLKKKGEEIDLDLEEALPPSLQNPLNQFGPQCGGPDGVNQHGVVGGVNTWPKRGPGSRGGKVRQPTKRVGRGGRKPAASIPPNATGEQDSDSANRFPGNVPFPAQQQETTDNFQGQNFNQNQFGFDNFNNQTGSFGNTNLNKQPVNNMDNMTSGGFQNKNFFQQQNSRANQNQFSTQGQNFDSSHCESGFNPNSSNDSNLNTSFDSSGETGFNQNDFNADFGSDFYSNNNFQNSGNNSNYSSENKSGFQGNNYFSNSGFQNTDNFEYPSGSNNMDRNFQNYQQSTNFSNSGSNNNFQNNSNFPNMNQSTQENRQSTQFQSSGSEVNRFPNPSTRSDSNFPTDFQDTKLNFEDNPSDNFSGQNFQNNSGFGENFSEQNRNSNFQGQGMGSNFQGNNYEQGYWGESNWGYPNTSKSSNEFGNNSANNNFMQQKFEDIKKEDKQIFGGNNSAIYNKGSCDFQNFGKSETDSKFPDFEEGKMIKPKVEEEDKKDDVKGVDLLSKKEDPSLPYDWATDLFKNYVTGVIENSSKMEVFFHIVTESIKLNDRLLVFSQSLLTLDLIEDYLCRRNVPDKEEVWAKNKNYFRLDGSTPGLEREKLINEFNSNPNLYLFLVSTRAGSLGINLVGANRVVVFDASWNPCHDTQAVCRVYRYGQRKPCFVYRLVMDSCLEKKIYDRQVNKQGMADRVVDELNPDAHLSIKEVTNLCWDDQEDTKVKDFSNLTEKYNDEIIKVLLENCSKLLSKEPFQHESLLIDRKEKKLSQAEKRLAKRSYELEKQAANQPKNLYSFFPNATQRNFAKPIASVRPMQSEMNSRINQFQSRSKWIPAEVWQKQGMSAQEMTLPLDVVIPTSSPEKTQIVLKAGQRVMVLKSPKGIYMQLENGKIIAIRSAFKVGQNGPGTMPNPKQDESKKDPSVTITPTIKPNVTFAPKLPGQNIRPGNIKQQPPPFAKPFTKFMDKKLPVNMAIARSRQIMGKAKPFALNRKLENVASDMRQRLAGNKMVFGSQEENFNPEMQMLNENRSLGNDGTQSSSQDNTMDELLGTHEKQSDGLEEADSLDTLRNVSENISDSSSRDNLDVQNSFSQMNLKNFPSQSNKTPGGEKKIDSENQDEKKDGNTGQQGNENVQNWLMNQSYPPMDPYGNYFPGYYYGPGPGPMMPPYEGFYPPNNYSHPMGRNSPMSSGKQQQDNSKSNSQSVQNPPQNPQNPPAIRQPPVVNTPPVYPPYPNPYPYPYNYPGNPGFNNQGFPFPNQNQTGQQSNNQNNSQNNNTSNPTQPFDNSGYGSFHRPEAPNFQNSENPYPNPYPRPPYPNNGTPGFFPYNAPYPNYPYPPNFNPYMHPGGYGYPMQNPPANTTQNPNTDNTATNNQTTGNNSSNNNANNS